MAKLDFIRENVEIYGECFTEMDLLKNLIGEKVVDSLEDNGINSLYELCLIEKKELIKIKGMTQIKLTQIESLKQLVKRGIKPTKEIKISSPNDIYMVCKYMENLEQEELKLICLNTKNEIIKNINIFKGGINSSIVDVRILMKEVLKNGSTSFIICHNHPSGDTSPSKEDINITTRIKESGKILGCELLDHIIIGDNKYLSLKEKGIV